MAMARTSLPGYDWTISQYVAGFWRLKHWGMTPQEVVAFVEECVSLGVTTVDHAMVYGSEGPFGAALSNAPGLRDQIEIVSKCGIRPVGFGALGAQAVNHYDSSKEHIVDSVNNSLKELSTDYLDLLLIHRPDYLLDVHQVCEAFQLLKDQGKVRAFGVSNFTSHQFESLQGVWSDGLVTNQVEFSPLAIDILDQGIFEQCQNHSISPMLWSCLGGGRLFQVQDSRAQAILDAVKTVQSEIDAEYLEQVVYAWVTSLPCKPTVLLGSSKIDRIKHAVASSDLRLNREQWYRIWEAANGASVP